MTRPAIAQTRSRAAIQRRVLRTLVAAQVLGGAGLAAGVAVGALLARRMLDDDATWTGLPAALTTLGTAAAAVPISRYMTRAGRRPGLVSGYLVGAAGSVLVCIAAATNSFGLLLIGMAAFGGGNTANLLSRFAAADLAPPERRGRAISTIVFATTVGVLVGPNLVGPMRPVARALELPDLAGPFVLSAAAYLAAAVAVYARLRPDPLAVAGGVGARADGPTVPVAWTLPALLGITTMASANLVMATVMTMTPVHMADSGHGLELVGLVISLHVAAMYAPSPLTGWAADRFGTTPVIVVGAAVLLSAGLLAAASGSGVALLTAALILLGVGWNLALIGGSTLLTASLTAAERPRGQGISDLVMGLAGAGAGAGSGVLLAATNFAALAAGAAAAAAVLGFIVAKALPARAPAAG